MEVDGQGYRRHCGPRGSGMGSLGHSLGSFYREVVSGTVLCVPRKETINGSLRLAVEPFLEGAVWVPSLTPPYGAAAKTLPVTLWKGCGCEVRGSRALSGHGLSFRATREAYTCSGKCG